MSDFDDTLRLDIWLWRARFFKTRSDAANLVTKKGVRIDRAGLVRRCSKPGSHIANDDVLSFAKGGHLFTIRVTGMPHRRGPASEAREHWDDLTLTDENESRNHA